jgi:Glycosyl transferase family 2
LSGTEILVRHAAETASPLPAPPAVRSGLPTVTVVVPCYRYADVLDGCVNSILTQRGVDVRVLIIDDLSPDDTPAVAQRLVARDSRVQYRRHEVNRGLIATANEGLDWAAKHGDYTVLLSADDQLVPGCLERATSVMEANPSVGMVYGWALYAHHGRALPRRYGRWLHTKTWAGADWIRLRCQTGFNCISSPEVVVRTSVQRAAGHYDPACTHSSDLNMWLRIAAISDIAHIRGVAQAIYRVHSDSMSRSDPSVVLSLRERRIAFHEAFARVAPVLRGAPALQRMADRALARQALWRASRTVDRELTGAPDTVEDLVSFAVETYPGSRRLREWRGFTLRRMLGPGRSRWFLPFLVTGIAHRIHGHFAQLRLRAMGK